MPGKIKWLTSTKKLFDFIRNKRLSKYENSDFSIKQKAEIFYFVSLAAIVSVIILIITYSISYFKNYDQINLTVLLPEIAVLIIFQLCITLLVKGYYNISVQLFLITANLGAWVIMFISTGDAISRIDTIVLIMAIVSAVPLLTVNSKWNIGLYITVNILIFIAFTFTQKDALHLSATNVTELLTDVIIAFIFIGIIGYQILKVNRKSIEKIESDFKERLKVEQQLVNSELRYRNIFENAQIGIYQTTPEGKILQSNPALIKMLGFDSFEELSNRNTNDPDAYVNSTRKLFVEQIEKQGFVKDFESEWKKKNNDSIIVRINARAVKGKNGKTIYYEGFVVNITEQKIIEKALKESEEKYRTLVEGMNEVVMLVDNEDKVLYVNKRFTDILGYTKEEIVGEIGYKILLDPKDHDTIIQENKERTKDVFNQYEMTFVSKSGKQIDFLVSGSPVKDTKGNTIGSMGAMTDITERKKIERELEKYRNHLEFLVQERTEELATANEELTSTNEELLNQREELEAVLANLKKTQRQLVHSEKMASLGVLAAGVAHEINNPLNFIKGGATGLEQYFEENLTENRDEVRPFIEGINVGVDRAAKIITSLNHYSRRNDAKAEECNMHTIIDNCIVMLQNKTKNRIEVQKVYTEKEHIITGNEGKLHQVVINILTNAIQAIKGKGTINIKTQASDQNIMILVKDTGEGIPKENISKVFDPFFTTKAPGEGTGLGLSITYSILEEHNGTIDIESKVGEGTNVIIQLPFNKNNYGK